MCDPDKVCNGTTMMECGLLPFIVYCEAGKVMECEMNHKIILNSSSCS